MDSAANREAKLVATIDAIATALELRDALAEGHCRRVREYSLLLAQELGVPEDRRHALADGALLHDVGYLAVPTVVVYKQGPLTDAEYEVLKKHTVHGHGLVARIAYPAEAADIVRHHHEHFDGGGYPDGLRGEAIPLGARVLAVADALDALTTDRPYRLAQPFEVARKEIARARGCQFDPQVVEALDRLRDAALHEVRLRVDAPV